MSVAGETYVIVRPDTVGFEPALASQVQTASRRAGAVAGRAAGASFSEAFGTVLKTGLAITGIATGLHEVERAVEATASHAGEIALVERAITNAGAAQDLYGDSIENVIRREALQKGFIDEQLYPAFTRLVGATHDTAKAYSDLQLAEDIARQRHIGVTVAALALAKAEQGSVTSLQRLGVILPANVRQLQGAEKATAALAITQDRFSGSAERFAETGAGALERFGEARHVLEEAAGAALLPEIEHAAAATAEWTSKSENLERVERDVHEVTQLVAGAVKATATGLEVVSTVAGPVVNALGGIERTAELAFGALAVKKILAWTGVTAKAGQTAVVAETSAATATTEYTAALAANTVALEANAAAQRLSLGGFNTLGPAVATAEKDIEAVGATAAVGRTRFLSLGLSGEGLAGVLRGGIAPAAVLAGYELSGFIRQIPHWDDVMKGFGGTLESVAEKLGLIGGGVSKASAAAAGTLADPTVQKRLADAYQQAAKAPAFARDKIIEQLVGPGYSFHDAQIFAQAAARARNRGPGDVTSADARRGAVGTVGPGRPTDVDYQIAVQQALATKTTADEEQLYKDRVAYLDKRIAALKKDGDLTADEKKNLLRLEQERQSTQDSITEIEQDAAKRAQDALQKQKQAAEKAARAYQDSISLEEQTLQLAASRAQLTANTTADDQKTNRRLLEFYKRESTDAKLTAQQRAQYASSYVQAEQQILQQDQQDYRNRLSLQEQRLQLAAKRAQLTDKTISDDKKAALALIAFYTKEAHDAKLTEAERLQYASQAIDERIQLKNLGAQGGGATAQELFAEAASEFHTYGSNIATRSGVLSGQDARAAFGVQLLSQRDRSDLTARAAADQRAAQLIELQRQTSLLARLVSAVAPKQNVPPSFQSADARRVANLVSH